MPWRRVFVSLALGIAACVANVASQERTQAHDAAERYPVMHDPHRSASSSG
jgi:hypothetical protein